MNCYYVVTGLWFEEEERPVDVIGRLEEDFDVIDVGEALFMEEYSANQEPQEDQDVVVANPDWGGIMVFHNSWGDSLRKCVKLKGYVVTWRDFDNMEEQTAWEREIWDSVVEYFHGS